MHCERGSERGSERGEKRRKVYIRERDVREREFMRERWGERENMSERVVDVSERRGECRLSKNYYGQSLRRESPRCRPRAEVAFQCQMRTPRSNL